MTTPPRRHRSRAPAPPHPPPLRSLNTDPSLLFLNALPKSPSAPSVQQPSTSVELRQKHLWLSQRIISASSGSIPRLLSLIHI